LAAGLVFSLIGAGPSSLLDKPTVIVYPFTAATSTISRETTSQLATIIATQMAATGRVTVLPPPPGTERKDFLSVARAERADYYIAGFMSPLGDGVSVVEQVVSTTSGIVIFSNTSQLTNYADAAGQGDTLATFVSTHANRTLASIGTPPPAASPSAAPSAGAQANLSGLFGHRKKPAAAASAAPSAHPALVTTTAPAAVVNVPPAAPPSIVPVVAAVPRSPLAVMPLAGSAAVPLRDAATARIVDRAHAERTTSVASACAEGPREAVLSGFLSLKPNAAYGAHASLDLFASDCRGRTLWNRTFRSEAGGAHSAELAMQRVVDAAVGAYLSAPKTR
jgi:TolB-like protein